MRLVFILIIGFPISSVLGQSEDYERKYAPDSLRKWTYELMTEMSRKHPGFYWYTPKDRFTQIIDSTCNSINDSLSVVGYYRKLKPLIAQIGCVHTSVTLPAEYEKQLDKDSTLVPITVFIENDLSVRLTAVLGKPINLPIGSRILSINGKPVEKILSILLKAIPADGHNFSEKRIVLNHHFALWYQALIESVGTYELTVRNADGTHSSTLRGIPREAFPKHPSFEGKFKKPLSLDIRDGIGVLTIQTFAKSYYRSAGQKYKKSLKRSFAELRKKDVDHLIVDLRYNTGGTDANAVLFASQFFDKPFRYWDRIEVTEAVADEIKGLYKLFYRKPQKIGSTYRWRKTWVTKEFNFYRKVKPARKPFEGKVYLLTNGLCMSSCSDLSAVLSFNKKAIVIGQETGGGFQGNCSGMIPKTVLPSGLVLAMPLQRYFNAADTNRNFSRGTIPQYEVQPSFEDWISENDTVMDFAMKLAGKE